MLLHHGNLDLVGGDLPEALVSREAWERVLASAAGVMPCADTLGLEVRLAGAEVDFFAQLRHGQGVPVAGLDAFAEAWAACPEDDAPMAWLEFDASGPTPDVPNVLFEWRAASWPSALLATLGVERAAVGPRPRYFGVMRARPGVPLRVVLPSTVEGLPRLLAEAGWPGSLPAAQERLRGLPCDFLGVSLTLGDDALLPDLGLELHFRYKEQPAWEPRWQRILEELVRRGACAPDRAEALLRLPRRLRVGGAWPSPYALALNTVKVTDAGAKAYLSLSSAI